MLLMFMSACSRKREHGTGRSCLRHLIGLSALFGVLAPWTHLLAEEPVFRFLRAAQAQGYGEVALDYLEQLRAAGRAPAELKETWDLELSRSYRAAVAEAYNAAEAETRLAKAQSHLDKFLKEHPDHAAVAGAMESWGDITLDRALEHFRAATEVKDAALKEKHFTAARRNRFRSRRCRVLGPNRKRPSRCRARAVRTRAIGWPIRPDRRFRRR